jgi:hypothetical protein
MKRLSSPDREALQRMLKRRALVEQVAALEHEQWMEWSRTAAKRVDAKTRARWQRYWVPYAELSEEVKEQDRVWARKILQAVCRGVQRGEKPNGP